MTAADDLVGQGRRALDDGDLAGAGALFERAAHAVGETAEVLEGLSQVALFQGRHADSAALKERAFAAYRRLDRPAAAAEVARWLTFIHALVNGNMAAAGGWMARAERLLEQEEEGVTHGWLCLDRAPFTRDPEEHERLALAGLAIGRRFGDADLEFASQALLGQSRVATGRTADGMRLLDEAMAAVAGGEVVGAGAISDIFCRLLGACELATDVRRAEEWLAASERLVAWTEFALPNCRCHFGGILIAVGRWAEAEQELTAALDAFGRGYRSMRAAPLVRLADLRLRQGRPEEAARLLEDQEWHPEARRASAGIALARGEPALAADLARACLGDEAAEDPCCGPLLELLGTAQLAEGDLAGASGTLRRLAALSEGCADARLRASAELAAGLVRGAEGDTRAAGHLRAALEGYTAAGLPLEAGRSRLALARALAPESPGPALVEARVALAGFERLGAARDADAAAGLLRDLGEPSRGHSGARGPLTGREREILALLAEGLTNAAIAERLVISRRTAEHHVANVLAKLGLRTRAQAAAHAAREPPPDG